MQPVKRVYRSPRRAAQAARTREAVVDATRSLLSDVGLHRTTMESIAASAGVSVQTVYASFGSKAAILIALLDRLESDAGGAEAVTTLARTRGAGNQLRELVAFHRRLYERGADVIAVGLGSVSSDPDIAAHVDAGHQRRRASQRSIVRDWHRNEELRAGLGAQEAADVLWSLTSPDVYLLHVHRCAWSPSRYARWLTSTLEVLLLAEGSTTPR